MEEFWKANRAACLCENVNSERQSLHYCGLCFPLVPTVLLVLVAPS